jgi:hypothetical protein
LRFFTNTENRAWLTSQTFEAFAPSMVQADGFISAPRNPVRRAIRSLAKAVRLQSANRSSCDDLMHRCHNAMKEDANFQLT